jgi:hypothetical protein
MNLIIMAAECVQPDPFGWPEALAVVGAALAGALGLWALVKYL